ncbi:hypothetical protein BDN71DRAFT_1457860 [Pleurotus eryngii]|uniref:Uncharacterized protein n=1 Tax=Pleurotus eryngii TaxID=5323 RepID=A0A9P5ZKH4_PLEER|nr:hypothetical protein BDN71DRAFT_1457860 [Pleurotus eryngii]
MARPMLDTSILANPSDLRPNLCARRVLTAIMGRAGRTDCWISTRAPEAHWQAVTAADRCSMRHLLRAGLVHVHAH